MSLDSNTTGLNEILAMANNLPEAGEGVQEIYYVNGTLQLSNTQPVILDISVDDLFAIANATPKKYVILLLSLGGTERIVLPMSASFPSSEAITFSNTVYIDESVAHISVTLYADGTIKIECLDEAISLTSGQKVFYVDCDFDFATFSVTSINKTYAEIVELLETGTYIVLRGKFAMVAEPTNIVYFPLSADIKEQGTLMFTGTVQLEVNGTMALVSFIMLMFEDNLTSVKVRVISTTDIK